MERTPTRIRLTFQWLPPPSGAGLQIISHSPALEVDVGLAAGGGDGRVGRWGTVSGGEAGFSEDDDGRIERGGNPELGVGGDSGGEDGGRTAVDGEVSGVTENGSRTAGEGEGAVAEGDDENALAVGGGRDGAVGGSGDAINHSPVHIFSTDWDDYDPNFFDPAMDLFLWGYPMSSFWKAVWEGIPLTLHDRNLLVAARSLNRRRWDGVDLTAELTNVLNNHPGPIECFRVDITECAVGQLLRDWLNILSAKGVEELVMINVLNPTDSVFPIADLQSSSLIALSIGFMAIPDLGIRSFDYTSLAVLKLMGCLFNSVQLSAVITDCVCLRELTIGFLVENLRISSQSLEAIHIFEGVADSLIVEASPKLQILSTGFSPRNWDQFASVSVIDAPSLLTMSSVVLPYHYIILNNIHIAEAATTFNNVMELELGIDMSSNDQRTVLRNMLMSFPRLIHLTIWKMEDEFFDEPLLHPFQSFAAIPCLKFYLRSFKFGDFSGGLAETDLTFCILRSARCLEDVTIQRHAMLSEEGFHDSIQRIVCYPRASAACHFNY